MTKGEILFALDHQTAFPDVFRDLMEQLGIPKAVFLLSATDLRSFLVEAPGITELIVLDGNLLGTNTVSFVERMRQDGEQKQIPLIVLVPNSDPSVFIDLQKLGAIPIKRSADVEEIRLSLQEQLQLISAEKQPNGI